MPSRLGLLLTALALVAAACGTSEAADTDLEIVATTTILGDIVSNVVGDRAEVKVLMPIGADPHVFQASSQQAAEVVEADLVIANGLGLEEGLDSLLESAEEDGANIVYIAPEVDPQPFSQDSTHHDDHEDHEDEGDHEDHEDEADHEDHEDEADHDDHEDEADHEDHEDEADHEDHEDEGDHEDHEDEASHAHDGDDPHVWLDPVRMVAAVDLIVTELEALDAEVDWQTAADSYKAELEELDGQMKTQLGTVPEESRVLVTNHDSLGYLADRYGYEVAGVVIPGGSTDAEPSSSDLAEIVEVIDAENVSAIFAETTSPTVLAEAVAEEAGRPVEVLELYTGSLGEEGSGAETYLSMMELNAERIVEGLDG